MRNGVARPNAPSGLCTCICDPATLYGILRQSLCAGVRSGRGLSRRIKLANRRSEPCQPKTRASSALGPRKLGTPLHRRSAESRKRLMESCAGTIGLCSRLFEAPPQDCAELARLAAHNDAWIL